MKKITLLFVALLCAYISRADGGWYGDKVRSASNLTWDISTNPPVVYAGDWLEGEIWLWYQNDPGLGAQFVYTTDNWVTTQYDMFSRGTVSGNDARYSDEGSAIGPWEAGTEVKYKIQCWHEWTDPDFYTDEVTFYVAAINPPVAAGGLLNEADPSGTVDLSWDLNSEGHSVMILRKPVGDEWELPENGDIYSVSDYIGSAVVVYNAAGTSFSDEGLEPSTNYEYRFYSVNNGYYSMDEIAFSITTSFAEGSGTEVDPYQVASAADLDNVRNYQFGGYFIQTADIDLSAYASGAGWEPIQVSNFGYYDGQGHTISHLTINRPDEQYVGLFGDLATSDGAVANLGLTDVDITGSQYVGAFAGRLVNAIYPSEGVLMQNCYATGTVKVGNSGIGGYYVGGLIGYLEANISRCYSNCTVENFYPDQWQYVGGLIGGAYNSSVVQNCYATGSVTASDNGFYQCLGGLIGIAYGISIEKSYATGYVSLFESAGGFKGGLVGLYQLTEDHEDCTYDSETTGQTGFGGDAGNTTAEMKQIATYLNLNWDFSSTGAWAMNGVTNNGYPYLRFQGAEPGFYWVGGTSSDWAEPSNWSGGETPGSTSLAVISAGINDPVASDVEVDRIRIEADGKLTVNGALSLGEGSSSLHIKSNASGSGSLICNSAIDAAVDCYLSGYLDQMDNMYHFISSPVSAQPIAPIFSNPPGNTTDDFYKFDEENDLWVNFRSGDGTLINPAFEEDFVVGRGYLVAYSDDVTKTFTGELNTGTLSTGAGLPALSNSGSAYSGWNLIGNPYPSSISWDNVSPEQATDLDDAVYVYDNASSTYLSYVDGTGSLADGIIPPMQGFFVHASGPAPSLYLENADRVHNNAAHYKAGGADNQVRLSIRGNNHHDEAYIRFKNQATSDFDSRYDAYKLYGSSAVPALYTKSGSNKLSINTLPYSALKTPVILAVEPGADDEYTITLTGNSLPSGIHITLFDNLTGSSCLLDEVSDYNFYGSPSDDAERFELRFSGALGIDVMPEASGIRIIRDDHSILVQGAPADATLQLFNMQGQAIRRLTATGNQQDVLDVRGLPAGVYVVRVETEKDELSEKVIISR